LIVSRIFLAAALAALSLGARAQAADPLFAAFAGVCAAPAADFAGVKAAADSAGWGPSDASADASMAGVEVTDRMARATTAERTDLTLTAWKGAKGGVTISDCAVRIARPAFPAMRAAVGEWAAFSPQERAANRDIYRFTDRAGARVALTNADFDAAAAGAGLQILTVSGDQSGTVLDLMMIKK
jgi:hypothetical protein